MTSQETTEQDHSSEVPFLTLLQRARLGNWDALGQVLQLYQRYLTILATTKLGRRLRRRVDPSDLVQDAMLAAHRDFAAFRGCSKRELLAWLRQILINCLQHAVEPHLKAKMRDMRREVSLEEVGISPDRSACKLPHNFADRGPSPSTLMQQRERAVALADQLSQLHPRYRDVIVLRTLQGLSFGEVADLMKRKPGTVRMLWFRATRKFKQIYQPRD